MPAIAAENEITIRNLLAAFEGESNAFAKYIAFAARPTRMDCTEPPASSVPPGAPSRFMPPTTPASSSSWAATSTVRYSRSMCRSTLENLKTALGGELHEVEVMYPEFLCRGPGA